MMVITCSHPDHFEPLCKDVCVDTRHITNITPGHTLSNIHCVQLEIWSIWTVKLNTQTIAQDNLSTIWELERGGGL